MELRMLNAADIATVPWANGRGQTRELACAGGDDWSWRVSLAESTEPAEFSYFEGTDRVLFLVRGSGLTLSFNGGEEAVLRKPADHARFSGESRVLGTPGADGTEQLNLMWKPDRAAARWTVVRGSRTSTQSPPSGAIRLWHVVEGGVCIGDDYAGAGETVIGRERAGECSVPVVITGTAIELTLISQQGPPPAAPSVSPKEDPSRKSDAS